MHQSSDTFARRRNTDVLFINLIGLLEFIAIFNFKNKQEKNSWKRPPSSNVSSSYCCNLCVPGKGRHYIHAYIRTCLQTYAYTHTYTYIHSYAYTQTYIHTHITYIYTYVNNDFFLLIIIIVKFPIVRPRLEKCTDSLS